MTSDLEYLLLKEKGPYHDVYVRRRLNTNPGACKFYTIVITIISISLLVLLLSLVYVFVLLPSWQINALSFDGRQAQEPHTHVLTHTQCGTVEGVAEDGVFVFKGIPYALPPVGARRWDKPRKLEGNGCWRGTYQAKRFRDMCLQPGNANFTTFVGSEDCLFLNVWTQHLNPSDKLPVMVWIHGGLLLTGSGNVDPFCPTTDMTKSTRTVYVSINYRLGPMGFLALETLAQSSLRGTSGNYGLMDVLLGLQWVRDNIRNFGGDPNLVTVFGEGAGATVIQALLASPLSAGLFHRAWLANPSPILNKTSHQASKENKVFLDLTGCADASCLRSLSSMKVMQGTPWRVFPFWAMDSLCSLPVRGSSHDSLLVVDGYVLKEAPLQAWQHGQGNDVPTLFSTTAQENTIQTSQAKMTSWTWEQYISTIRTEVSLQPLNPDVAERALELYPVDPAVTPESQYSKMVSDARVTCPVQMLANVSSAMFRSPVFQAAITSSPSAPIQISKIFQPHCRTIAWDVLAFFGNFDFLNFRPTKKDLDFQRILRQQIMAFARTGRPETSFWGTAQNCTALISDHVFPVRKYDTERCGFWLANGVFS